MHMYTMQYTCQRRCLYYFVGNKQTSLTSMCDIRS